MTFGFIQDTNSLLAEGLALFLTVAGQIDAFVVETHVLMSLFSLRHQTFLFLPVHQSDTANNTIIYDEHRSPGDLFC